MLRASDDPYGLDFLAYTPTIDGDVSKIRQISPRHDMCDREAEEISNN